MAGMQAPSGGTSSGLQFALRAGHLCKTYRLHATPWQRLLFHLMPRLSPVSRDFSALQDVSFELAQGETLGIIGRNGSGKSTLLQLITGTLSPSSGTVECKGRVAALLELGAGFNPDFTGRENVRLNAAMYGLGKEEIEARMADIVAFAAIGDFIDQPVRLYSSGMFVRLAFSVIVHVDADVLIIDEALAVGDVQFSHKCMRFLEQFKQRGSILFVSHDSGAVSRLCDRVLWLDQGRVMALGEPREMLDRYHEHLYGQQQLVQAVTATGGANATAGAVDGEALPKDGLPAFEPWFDAREAMQGSPALYNAMTVHRFNEHASGFGDGGASITDVCIRDRDGRKLSGVLGGTPVVLEFHFIAHRPLQGLIVGYLIKDRLGQVILGDNNVVIHQDSPRDAEPGKRYAVKFGLTLPYLAISQYIVSVAVASGTQSEHVQHCWLHDALVFAAEKGPVVHGIMGVPMAFCEIREQA